MKKPNVEVECKLVARDASVLAGALKALREVCSVVRYLGREVIQDVYLDTRDWGLFRAGYACRIRRTSRPPRGRAVLAVKALTRPRRMVSAREELEQAIPWCGRAGAETLATALLRRGAAGKKIRDILAGRKARAIFRIRNRRETYALRFGGEEAGTAFQKEASVSSRAAGRRAGRNAGLRAHVSLDNFVVLAAGKRRRLAEVEIEIKSGTPADLRRLARLLATRVGLGTRSRAKFQQGLELAGLAPASSRTTKTPKTTRRVLAPRRCKSPRNGVYSV